jgi:hypothetical protein
MLPSGATAGPSVRPPVIFAERAKRNSSFASSETIEGSPEMGGRSAAKTADAKRMERKQKASRISNSLCQIADRRI